MARDAAKIYKTVSRDDMRFILVEAANRILPEMGPDLGLWTKQKLEERNIEIYIETSMDSCVDGHVVLKNGIEADASTIVWTAGVKPNPVVSNFGLPLGPRGHVDTAPTLQVQGFDYVWAMRRQRPGAGPRHAARAPGARRTPSTRCVRRSRSATT